MSKEQASKDITARQVSGELPMTPDPGPKAPDVPQMDPGQKQCRLYTFTDGAGHLIAKTLVPKIDGSLGGVPHLAGVEYWYNVSAAPPSTTLTVAWVDFDWATPPSAAAGNALSFRMAQAPQWASARVLPASSPRAFVASNIVLCWNLTWTTAGWAGDLTWFNTDGQNKIFFSTQTSGSATLTAGAACNPRVGWYQTAVAPY